MNLARYSILILVALFCAGLEARSPEQTAGRIAMAAGYLDFHKVERIEFTFNARIGDKTVKRSWLWWPQTDRVRYEPEEGAPVDYFRDVLENKAPESLREVDQKFVNDSYWLIFPFKVVWDRTISLETIAPENFTAGIEAAGGLRVIYPEGVSYTPGDIYEVYYDENYLVTHWVFRKGGSAEPSRITEWNNYETIGPLQLSLDRPGYRDDDFRIRFSGVRVKYEVE